MKTRLWDTEKKVMLLPEYSDSEIMIQLDGSIMEYRESRYPYGTGQYFNVPEDRFVKMLSTGINDKNGKGIHVGDIVAFDGHTWEDQFTDKVEFANGMFRETFWHRPLGYYPSIEVIGNIYENPELLPDAK